MEVGLEESMLARYVDLSQDEVALDAWLGNGIQLEAVILTEGFEERSLGVLEHLSKSGVRPRQVIVSRYVGEGDLNTRYRQRLETLAQKVSPNSWRIVENRDTGEWVTGELQKLGDSPVLLDITGLSRRGIYGALDAAAKEEARLYLAYTEAREYWPTEDAWQSLRGELSDTACLPEVMDTKPWLFGPEQEVDVLYAHEGYDSGAGRLALIGFLAFKYARLAAIIGDEDYSDFLFIAGRPRPEKMSWRVGALEEINESLVKNWPVVYVDTFRYRRAISRLSRILFKNEKLLHKYDVHMAITGSKLQTVACWVVSSIVKAITVKTSIPSEYYPGAFSEGIGNSYVFPFCNPISVLQLVEDGRAPQQTH